MANPTTLNITHNLTNTLGLAIVRGEYMGALPSEAELCNQYGVSRSSTREAVKMLSAKGLIRSRPKQGIRIQQERYWNMFDSDVLKWILVSKPTLELLKEFLDVRVVIEPQAASLAAKHADKDDLDIINQALARIKDADNGLDDPMEADVEFHSAVFEATKNRFFVQFTDFVSTALRVTLRYTSKKRGSQLSDVSYYQNLYDAIAQGNAIQAETLVKETLAELCQVIES